MRLHDMQIIPVRNSLKGLVAFASFVVDDQLYVGDVAVYKHGDGNGYRLVYPTRILGNGRSIQIVHPINREAGEAIREQVIQHYRNTFDDAGSV